MVQGTSGKGGIGFLGNLRDLFWIKLQQVHTTAARTALARPALWDYLPHDQQMSAGHRLVWWQR